MSRDELGFGDLPSRLRWGPGYEDTVIVRSRWGIERPDMKLGLMLIASWLVASVSISIVLGKALKRLDSPMPSLAGDPSFGHSPKPEPTIGRLDAETGKVTG